jgi:hypothetical protein
MPGYEEQVAYAVASIALSDSNPSVRDFVLFWEQVAGTDSPSEALAGAFIEGALEIFHAVEDKI